MNLVVVPCHLDALFLAEPQFVASTKAAIDRLPYSSNGRDHHADTPYLSGAILADPFHNDTLYLKAGLHLHWALPDAMTQSIGGASQFPMVPNRWMVRRLRNGTTEKSWVVESDYLFPAGRGQLSGSIPYPFPKENPDDSPFRYLGRQLPFRAWANSIIHGAPNARYLKELTAVGYGDPTFAAQYPNCHSVFGCYDRDITEEADLKGLTYQLLGWYNSDQQDFLLQLFDTANAGQQAPQNAFELYSAIEEATDWHLGVMVKKNAFFDLDGASSSLWDQWLQNKWLDKVDDDNAVFTTPSAWATHPDEQSIALMSRLLEGQFPIDRSQFDSRTLCLSSLTFADQLNDNLEHPALQSPSVPSLTIGNTGTEALSAFLAHRLADNEGTSFSEREIEDQLEAIQLSSKIEHRRLDVGPKFEEGRHEKGFNAVDGGIRWAIQPQTDPHVVQHAPNVAEHNQVTLPATLGYALNRLNGLQDAYHQGERAIKDLKSTLFADWCKYLQCVYTPDGTQENFIDPDEVRYFIQQKDLPLLQEKTASVGILAIREDNQKTTQAEATQGEPHSLAHQVADAVNALLAQLDAFNKQGGLLMALKLAHQEDNGRVRDHSGHDRYGQLSSRATTVDDEKFGKAIAFDGQDAALSLPALKGVRSLSAWVNIPADANGCLLQAGSNLLGTAKNSGWRNLYINGQEAPDSDWTNIPKGTWAHLFLVPDQPVDQPIRWMSRGNGKEYLQGRLAHVHVYDYVLTPEEISRDANHFVRRQFVLQATSGNRFWQPKEPVVLVEGDLVQASDRHGFDGQHRADGRLQCYLHEEDSILDLVGDDTKIEALFNDLKNTYGQDHFLFDTWAHQPWNPLLLEWEVILSPLYHKGNLREGLRVYDKDFILSTHEMLENHADLTIKPDQFNIVNVAYEYVGSSILTPSAGISLRQQLEDFLKKQLLIPYYNAHEVAEADQNFDFSSQVVQGILNDYLNQNEDNSDNDPTRVLIDAHRLVTGGQLHTLSQALGGFNDALLMRHLVMQTPVEDPTGFSDYQAFAQEVATALGRDIYSSPRPENDFNPIRSGIMRINQLRLVDTFGRSHPLYSGTLGKTHHMEVPGKPDMVHLRPRFVQPARLDFRWLSAHDGEQEMNNHPATSPICGWLLANNLDNSIMVFEQSGDSLCSLGPGDSQAAILRHPPGPKGGQAFDLAEITNPFLRTLVNHLLQQTMADGGFLQDFITVIDSSLDNIDPENHAQHANIALLMSRPVAVTRGCLKLELAGLPAINHDMNVFRNDLVRNSRQSEAFTEVDIPIRLGEYNQLNDGLVGYWVEDQEGFRGDKFYAPQSNAVQNPHIVSRGQEKFNLNKSLSEAADFLTLLVDPRGKIHATTGVFPTSVIELPPEQYMDALNRIAITFLSTPLLSDSQQVQIPLPAEAGYRWSWLANTGDGWDEIFVPGTVRKKVFLEAFPEKGSAIWDTLNNPAVAWIKTLDEERAEVVRRNERAAPTLDPKLPYDTVKIEAILSRASIGQAPLKAHLNQTTVIREGWLKLKKTTQ